MAKYITDGMVDGSCNHHHPSLSLAERCRLKYKHRHSFSDRTVKKIVNNKIVLLNAEEVMRIQKRKIQ